MPIYRVNNTTYNIPDDMSVKFEQRFPNAKIDMYNGEEKYSIPVNEKNNFVKAYPKATFEYQGNDTSSQEQPSAPVQDFQPSQEVKDYALDNIPDMFKSKGNNLSTRPLQTQEDFSGGTSDSMKHRIEQAKRATNDQYMRQFAIEQVFKPKGEKLSTRPLQTQEDFFGETLDFMNRIATDENQRFEQAKRAANDPYMRQQEIEHVFKPKNQEQINTVRNLIEEQNKRLDKRLSIHSGSGNNAFNALANSTRYNRETSDDRNQKAVLGYAEKLIEQAQNITDEAKRKGNTNFLAGFYRGFRDTPLDVWAMGLANLRDYAVANQVMDKVDKGEKLNPAEDALMQALVTNAATQMYYAGDLGRGYKAGGAIHESLPFMLDMLLGMGTIQAVTKPAAKSLLKYATEKAVKYGLGKATTGLAKGAARTISGLRDVAAHTATFGSQRVAADYLRRGLGDIQVKPNEDGTVSYDGRENIQTGGEAIGKAIVSTAAETGSELLGEYFGPMLGWIGRATGANRIGKIIPSSVGKAYSSLVNSQGFKQVQEIARRAKIADPIGEYSEEVVNNLISTAIGDMTPEQLVDLDQNIDTFLGVAPMSALFGAAGTAGYLRGQYRNYRNMRQFENRMQEEMGEDWSGVREALQDADIETAREMVKDVLSSDMTPQMKKDAITYISSVLQEQTLQNVDKQSMPEDIAQAKRDILTNLSNTRRQIPLSDEQLGVVMSRVESQGPSALDEMGFTSEQQDMIMSYNDAYQDYNNYTFWVQDMARNARRQAEQQVESLTNATTGTVMRVKAGFSQEPVNILRGNIAFDAEGKVDREKSDNVVYYLDKDGKVQMSSIDAIENVIDDSPAEEVAAQAGTDAENEVLQSEEAQVNPPIELGTVFNHNGQNYVVGRKTPDGYEIAAVDESGELIPGIGTQEVSEEDLRNAIAQSSTEGQITNNTETAPEQPVSTETQPESPAQGESSETSQEQEPQTALSRIPTNEKGEQDFEAAPAEDTGAALMEISEDDIDDAKDTANQMILSYQEQLKKADKMKTTGASIQEIVKLKQEKKEAIRQINDKIRYWQSVSDAIEKKRPRGIIAEAKKVSDKNQQRLASMTPKEQSEAQAKVQENIDKGLYERPSQKRAKTRYVKEDNELGQANTPMEHVLREIATGRVSFLWNDNGPTQGLGRHLGYSDSSTERKRLIWAFSNESGMTPEAASEAIHADMPENLQGMVTDQDIFNMIVQAFQEYGSPSKMWKAAKEMHGTDEIESMPAYRQDIERQALEWEAAENNMTVQEWIAYCDFIEEELDNMFSSVSDEELNTIFEQFYYYYERRNETESAGSTQGQADSKQSDEILPSSGTDNAGTDEEGRKQPEPANKTDGESGSVVPEPEGTVDNNGYPFLKSSNETTIFGEIREETGLTPAPIKLSEGFNRKDEKGRNHGYGFKHIEESHGDQIRNYGFESIPEFVESVAKNYTIVRKGNKRNGIDTYILEVSDKKNNTLFVELSKDGSYWNVNSAGVFRKGYSKKKEVVWPLPAVEDASTAEDTGVQNAADSSNSMSGNSPQNASFIDKDTQSLEEKQEDKQKFTASEINQDEGVIEYAQRIAKEKEIWDESQKVDINPTEGQKEAGNYKKGRVKIDGYDVTIENPKGSVRSGKDANGKEWSVTMNNTYGYIRGTRGVDGDHIDIFLSDNPESGNVYVIDQVDQQTGMYDESKVMYGFNSIDEAKDAYLSNYEEGWKVGVISEVSKEEFKKWIESSTNKIKPFSEYKNVDVISAENDGSAKDIQPKENVVTVSEMGNTTNIEKAQNQNKEKKQNTETIEPKFLSESEYVKQKVDEDFKNSGIEDRQEWDESDESLDSFNKASDEYPNYISNLSKSGELQRIYDQSNIGEKIKIRESVEAAGYEINELIDVSKEKSTAKEKRKRKREARSKELMEKLGINSGKNNDIVPSGKENNIRYREEDSVKRSIVDRKTNELAKEYLNEDLSRYPYEDRRTDKDKEGEVYYGYSEPMFKEENLMDSEFVPEVIKDIVRNDEYEIEPRNITKTLQEYIESEGGPEEEFARPFVDALEWFNENRKDIRMSDKVNLIIDRNDSRMRDGSGMNNASSDSTEDIKREVEKTAYKLNVPAEVITSTDQINDESVRKAIESGRKIKGWYSLSDRKVYVYLPNTSSVEDAKQTILHEGVAHFGLRKLVGDENMDSFLDDIFANVTKEVREEIISTLPRYGWDSRVATEEYLASMAEQGADVSVWQRIIQAFKNLLRKIGIRMEINDKELRYILWRSRQNLESGNVLDMAKDIAMQYEMGVGNYYREVEQTPEQSTVDAWDKIASSTMFSLRESAVDYLTAVDKFQELISKRSGKEIKPFENAYDSMTFLSSKNRVEMDWFDSNIVTPMRKAILALVDKQKGRKWDWGKGELRRLVMYVEAKHGTERNRQMAVEKFIKEFRPESLKFFEKAGISIDRKKYEEELDSIKEKARKKAYEKSFRKIYDNLVKEGTQKEEAEKEAKKRADAIALIAESNASEKFWNDSRDKLMKEYTEKFMSEWNDIKKRISEKKDMSWIEKQKELDKEASRLGADLTQDYSGLSSVFGDENTYPKGWYEESMNFVDEYEKSHEKKDIDGLWKSISDATGYTLNKQYESGLVSKEYVETQKKRFENYIPLRGFQDEIAGDVYNYIGNDFYPGSNPVKSAGGRTSEPGNPFGSILNTGYSTISVGNKNLAKMSFFSLVNNHDTEGLAVAGRAWAVKYDRLLEDEELREVLVMPDLKEGEEIPEWVEAVPKYPERSGYNTNDGSKNRTSPVTDMSSEDVAKLLGRFEEVMKKNSKEGYAKPISKKSKIAYRTLYNERSEHEIPLFILGDKYVITITGNPRVAQAMNGLLNPNVNNKGWSEIGEKVQRFMAGAMTAKNAAFSIGNLSKDSIYANNQVFIKENTSYWLRFTKNQKGGFGDFIPMMIRLKNYRDGKLDMSDKSDVMFKEFMDNGGATGYTFVDTQEKYAKELADKLKELSRKTPGMIDPRKITKAFFDSVEFTGQAAELVNRFAAYRTSREMGRSVNRSIRDAKEITVNFNRKGAGMKSWNDNKSVFNPLNTAAFLSQYGLSCILFWNANMQAKYRFYRNIKEHPIKTTTTLIGNSMLFSSVLIPFMNNFALPALYEMFGCGSEDDDEDYYNVLTDFERTRNICVRLPHGNWLKIPLSPDMSPWFAMGDCIGGAITGQRELSASDFIKSGIDAISPLPINWSYEGPNIVLNVLPTIFQPGAQIAMNVNFMGNPIRKQPFTMRQGFAPKYTMVYGNTSTTLIELSRLSNRLTGGNDRKTSGSLDWNPADIQNLITGYTGGYGSSFLSAADWIVSTLKGEEQSTTIGKMPLVSRFFISGNKDVKVRRVNSSFYDVIRFTEEFKFDRKSLEDEIQNSLKEGNKEKAMQSRKDLEELLNSDRAKKFIELESIVEAAKDFDRYMKEIPEDENTKGIIYEIKMKGIERLKQK